ncbi:histidine phosphatase family protein [Lachnoclostridium sp. An131]|jgi:broad specificity phosphatase PhoE|uniref:histidine phosphatase family protein n=1 Tax=Lachnoclostridium sp. An131 TaxID=1965555 RepID=UPI000B36FA1F|nr:histidine phosphatase family protein [Lachnoclostridium sp. An131]OUQ23445.1 histidine phosphatase family protein [Lachnoclostridium sp. An131]
MQIYIIRHGETDWNTKRLLQGATDIPLNQNGIEVAKLTSAALKEVPFDIIYTSPLQRAVQTAEIMRGDREIPVILDDRLKEISFGPYEGLCCSREGYSIPDPEFVNFFTDPAHYTPPEGGESIAELCVRTTDFLTELIRNPDMQDKTVLLSGHGAVVKGLLSSLTITDMKDFWKGGVHKNCGVSMIEVKNGEARLLQENVIYYDENRSTNYFE